MFYISERQSSKWGITDTFDNLTEYYTLEEIVNIIKEHNISILGVNLEYRTVSLQSKVCAEIYELEVGTPLRLKYSKNLSEKQVLYQGSYYDANRKCMMYRFYDGSGVTGCFEFSSKYLYDNRQTVSINFNNNPSETATLLLQLRG